MIKARDLFDLPKSLEIFLEFFDADMPPWEWIKNIGSALKSINFKSLESKRNIPAGVSITGDVYLHPSVKLPPFAQIIGPSWIGAGTEIRMGCFIRGNVIAGEGCVMGNSCEYKNSLLMDKVQTPHYNYVGDSVMGSGSHIGAGAICANLRLDKGDISVRFADGVVNTGMRKLGAIMGEEAEAGCNAVLQPGSVLMKRSVVMTGIPFAGFLEENTIAAAKIQTRKIPRKGF